MLGNQTLTAFVATADATRAKAFYGDVLGLELTSEDPFAIVFRAANATVRVQKVTSLTPQPFTALGWAVDDIAAIAAALVQRGVRLERYEGMGQDETGIWTSPGGARVAWFKDPDGNVLSVTQHP
ncbi:MAG: VOC family protein [Polyangiaceae bacterium]|nr:VOC family protein [Polyangiaceae bacterium]